MTPFERNHVAGVPFSWRHGVRGHPGPPTAWRLLVERAAGSEGRVLDASGLAGVPGRAAAAATTVERVEVFEPSAAALAALHHDLAGEDVDLAEKIEAHARLPWDAEGDAYDVVLLAPPAERGSARVRAELRAAAAACAPSGSVWVLLDRDRGAKRYLREASAWFGAVEVYARDGSARLAHLCAPKDVGEFDPWSSVGNPAPLPPMEVHVLPGVWSTEAVDPGTQLLLQVLRTETSVTQGDAVVDLGCGWGPLAIDASLRGGTVTALDDDLAAVRSCRRALPEATVLHADVLHACPTAEIAVGGVSQVWANPPFHVGTGVRVNVGERFVEVALEAVRPGGEVWMVANAALPYERVGIARGAEVTQVAVSRGFKVLRFRSSSREP